MRNDVPRDGMNIVFRIRGRTEGHVGGRRGLRFMRRFLRVGKGAVD